MTEVFSHKSAQNESPRDASREAENLKGFPHTPSQNVDVDRSLDKSLTTTTSRRHIYTREKPKLRELPKLTEWWDALADQYPNVNLHAELLKAMDWHRADLVKSPKLYFRNWVERAAESAPARDLTPEQARDRLRIVV